MKSGIISKILFILIFSLTFLSCGSDSEEEGQTIIFHAGEGEVIEIILPSPHPSTVEEGKESEEGSETEKVWINVGDVVTVVDPMNVYFGCTGFVVNYKQFGNKYEYRVRNDNKFTDCISDDFHWIRPKKHAYFWDSDLELVE